MAMDIETAEAVETLRSDIHRVDRPLTARLDRMESSLTARLAGMETSLTARIDHMETSLRAQAVDTRRHMDVVGESLRDDIRMIADGVVALAVKIDSLPR